MSFTAVEVLREARELIAAPGGWCQNQYHRTSPLDGSDRFCPVGAVDQVTEFRGYAALYWLNRAAGDLGFTSVPAFNDRPGRTQAQAVALFDAAISLAENDRRP